MRLVRCDACGAKAILAASQCPKCAEPLYVRNERGDEVRLVGCRSCGTFYPSSRDGCRWCPAVERASMPRWTGKAVVAVVTLAASLGAWQFLPASSTPEPLPNVIAVQAAAVPRLAAVAVIPSPVIPSTQRAKGLPAIASDTGTRAARKAATSVVAGGAAREPTSKAVAEPRPTRSSGSTDLVSAKATTWVNVRAEANARSAIVGMILPDSIVELGERRGGWRRVSTRWFSGWASARLFAVDSLGR